MIESDIKSAFQRQGVIYSGHIILHGGLHTSTYILGRAIRSDVMLVSHLCGLMADQFQRSCPKIDIVVGPESGGDVLSYCTAAHLLRGDGVRPLSLVAEKDGKGGFIFPEPLGKKMVDRNVVVVDDTVTDGGSINKALDAVRRWDGNVVGVGVIWNRGNVTKATFAGIEKFFALVSEELPAWDAAECPLCAKGIPIDEILGRAAKPKLWDF